MRENNKYHFILHGYLSNADQHYMEGRFLWFNLCHHGASNLLWLSLEQMITIVIFESRLFLGKIDPFTIKKDGVETEYKYDPQEKDIKKIDQIISRTLYKIERRHRLEILLKKLQNETKLSLDSYYPTLEKLKEFHDRRYYENVSTSINHGIINQIDEVFFKLRNMISEFIPRALIDEIAYQQKFKTGHPLPCFVYTYKDNKHFSSRKHPEVNQMLPDGRKIRNNGSNDEIIKSL